LNEDLVAQARKVTDNLSAEAESLRRSATAWHAYAEKHGSFADEFSTL